VTVTRRYIGDWLWPAECADCTLVTEDPDAHHDDPELNPATLCPATDRAHRWRSVDDGLAERAALREAMTALRNSIRPRHADETARRSVSPRWAAVDRLLDTPPPAEPEPLPSRWVVEYRVHPAQRASDEWVRIPATDEADARDRFARHCAYSAVIEARIVCEQPRVVEHWLASQPEPAS